MLYMPEGSRRLRPPKHIDKEKVQPMWESFKISRNEERRFGKVVLGKGLPNNFDINVLAVNKLIRRVGIRGSVVIGRIDENAQKNQPVPVGNIDGTGSAGMTDIMFMDEDEDEDEVENESEKKDLPELGKYEIPIDFDTIRAKVAVSGSQEPLVEQAQLIEEAVFKGLVKVAKREKIIDNLKDSFTVIQFAMFCSSCLMFLIATSDLANPEYQQKVISKGESVLFSAALYAFTLSMDHYTKRYTRFSKSRHTQDEMEDFTLPQYFKEHFIPPELVAILVKHYGIISSSLSHENFIRPTKK